MVNCWVSWKIKVKICLDCLLEINLNCIWAQVFVLKTREGSYLSLVFSYWTSNSLLLVYFKIDWIFFLISGTAHHFCQIFLIRHFYLVHSTRFRISVKSFFDCQVYRLPLIESVLQQRHYLLYFSPQIFRCFWPHLLFSESSIVFLWIRALTDQVRFVSFSFLQLSFYITIYQLSHYLNQFVRCIRQVC